VCDAGRAVAGVPPNPPPADTEAASDQTPHRGQARKAAQKTLAKKRAEAQRRDPPDPSEVLERTMITKVPG